MENMAFSEVSLEIKNASVLSFRMETLSSLLLPTSTLLNNIFDADGKNVCACNAEKEIITSKKCSEVS